MDTAINLIIIIAYVVAIALFIINHVKVSKSRKKDTLDNNSGNENSTNDTSHSTPLYLIRNQYFPSTMEYSDFFISEFMVEAFNIFINVVPSMISTLSKAERRISMIKSNIDNTKMTEEDIKTELKEINPILTDLMEASHNLIAKLEEVASNIDNSNVKTVQLDPKSVEIYMSAVNVLMQLADDHSLINSHIHLKLIAKYPDLVTPFRVVSGKLAYIYFVILITYSNKIDENVSVYN